MELITSVHQAYSCGGAEAKRDASWPERKVRPSNSNSCDVGFRPVNACVWRLCDGAASDKGDDRGKKTYLGGDWWHRQAALSFGGRRVRAYKIRPIIGDDSASDRERI